jgi:hypothetical protein
MYFRYPKGNENRSPLGGSLGKKKQPVSLKRKETESANGKSYKNGLASAICQFPKVSWPEMKELSESAPCRMFAGARVVGTVGSNG